MTGEKIEEKSNRFSSSGVVISAHVPEALYHIKVIENPCTLHNRDPFYIPVYPGKISLQRIKVGWIGVHRERIEASGVDFWRPVLECQRGFADKVARENLAAVIAVKKKARRPRSDYPIREGAPFCLPQFQRLALAVRPLLPTPSTRS